MRQEADTIRSFINRMAKRQATFFGHAIRRQKLGHLVTTGMIEGKRSRGKQRVKVLDELTESKRLHIGQVTDAQKRGRIEMLGGS